MKFSVITLFPEMFEGAFKYSIIGRALKEEKIYIDIVDLRNFGIGFHKSVDDKPYGGGTGMILRVDVLHNAIKSVREHKENEKVAIFDAKGTPYKQHIAEEWSNLEHLILVCGRYEGFDERIKDFVDYSISIGDFVLTGGEIPAMAVVDSVTRLIPEVLSKSDATTHESFSKTNHGRILEQPQYTRPEIYKDKKVPDVLLSGHDANKEKFRKDHALNTTRENRPDLIDSNSQE